MPSLGEADVQVNSRIVGKVRILRLSADTAIYPRIVLESGFTLYDDPDAQFAQGVPATGYEVVGMTGELRLSEHGSCVAPVYWSAPDRNARPSPRPYEAPVRLVADLDPWRLERIEEARGTNSPPFWLALWLSFVAGGQPFKDKIIPFRIEVPREHWLQFLAAVRHDEFEVIEVRYDKSKAERFRKALQEVATARARIVAGDYNEAVTACRRALEAVSVESDIGKKAEDWKTALTPKTDERRAKEYAGVFTGMKELAALTVHPSGQPVVYSRSEALFVVRTTENLLALLGDLTSKP
jgi:hypothetical protein